MSRRVCGYCQAILGVDCKSEGTHRIATPQLGRFVWACDIAQDHWKNPPKPSQVIRVG